jgi:hypothetical protein
MRQRRFYTDLQLVARATTDLETQRYLDLADQIARDPAIRALRLRLYATRNRASTVAIRARAAVGPPPIPARRQCYRPRRCADSSNYDGEASDAR